MVECLSAVSNVEEEEEGEGERKGYYGKIGTRCEYFLYSVHRALDFITRSTIVLSKGFCRRYVC